MNEAEKYYWDSTCFICFLNEQEQERRRICEDILINARNGLVEIWTSQWTIVEVIRPKRRGNATLPDWAAAAITAIQKDHPEAREELETLWYRHQVASPSTRLTPDQITRIQGMFDWDFIRLIDLDKRVALRAVEISRDCGMRPADSVHVASGLIAGIPVIQRWDRDFDRAKQLIRSEEPQWLSAQRALFSGLSVAPLPSDFDDTESTAASSSAAIAVVDPEPSSEQLSEPVPKSD